MTATAETDAPAQPPAKNPPLNLTLELEPKHPHLVQGRGLTAETSEAFGVGYCKRGVLRGTIAIPIFDEQGLLVAYAGRRLKAEQIEKLGKYVLPKGFRKELVLYHYNRARSAMDAEGLILVESYFTVMKLFQLGFRNAVAAMGADLSEQQAALLAHSPEVIVLFDGDEAGRLGTDRAKQLLAGKTTLRLIWLPEGHKPDTITPRALRWLVNGARALDLAAVEFTFTSP